MTPRPSLFSCFHPRGRSRRRGSVLITALLIATVLGIGLVSYLSLSRTALKLAHRTLFISDASNLAEAGIEDALYCFNQANSGVAAATAWAGWTIVGSTARRTLPQFNRNQNGIGTVKVFVNGYNTGAANSFIISQATITSFDGSPPIVRIMRVGLTTGAGPFINGLVGINGISLKGQPLIDSFNSNPTNSATGPWLTYNSTLSASNASVVVKTGAADLGNGQIKGNLMLGPTVVKPSASQVTGTITDDFNGEFRLPTYPTAAGVSRSYNLGSTIPTTLPVSGHLPASDGKYYYFTNGATISNTTITAGRNVIIVGNTTSVTSGVTIATNATLAIYIDGVINSGSQNALNNANWAGALQVFSTTATECTLSGNGELRGSFYLPNAPLKASGGGSSGRLVGSFIAKSITITGQMSFHYDEALKYLTIPGSAKFGLSSFAEIRSPADIASVQGATGGFLP